MRVYGVTSQENPVTFAEGGCNPLSNLIGGPPVASLEVEGIWEQDTLDSLSNHSRRDR